MLQFRQNDTAVVIILTLTELVTIPAPIFLFAFTHVVTKDLVAFVKGLVDDQSDYPDRYNQFTIDPSALFDGAQPGEWHYQVFQQTNPNNLIPANADSLLESGKLILDRAGGFAFTLYDSPTTFKTYNG